MVHQDLPRRGGGSLAPRFYPAGMTVLPMHVFALSLYRDFP